MPPTCRIATAACSLMATLFGLFPFLRKLYADGGYQGPVFRKALARVLRHIDLEIVKRSDGARGFEVLPKRWIVERTIGWLNRCRRLAKDWENLNRKALAFLNSPPSASCCENSAIPHDLPGQIVRKDEGFWIEAVGAGGGALSRGWSISFQG